MSIATHLRGCRTIAIIGTVKPLHVLAAALLTSLAACGGGGGPGDDDLPSSFRFTVASNPCFDSTFTVSDAREAVPTIAGQYKGGDLACSAAADVGGAWSIACANQAGSVEVRLSGSFDSGSIVVDDMVNNTICEGTHPMLTVEVITP